MNGKTNEDALNVPPSRRRQPKCTGGARLGQGRSVEARKQAAAILEVLAGARTPPQAAAALDVSLPRYYQVEQRALAGLLAACEPQPRGRRRGAAVDEARKLRRENERLQRELGRQQALVRLVQRNVGLPPAPAPSKAPGKKRKPRRPVARALAVADRLRDGTAESTPAAAPAAPAGGTI
jgi:hypothetical protein